MKVSILVGTLALIMITSAFPAVFAGVTPVVPECGDMYGSAGNSGTDLGSIFLVSQTDGSQTFLGDPTTDGGLSGIAFDGQANLWGSNVGIPIDDSHLLQINPFDGSLINDVGSIVDAAGDDIKITDLAFDPISDQLFGAERDGVLVTIDRTTAVATFVGTLPNEPMHIGFSPTGTLWAVDRSAVGNLFTLDPTNANVLTQVIRSPTGELDALGVDPATGVIWVARTVFDGLGEEVSTIDPAGNRVVVGSGLRVVADLDFLPCPVKVGGEFLPIDSTSLLVAGAQTFSWMIPVVLSILGIGLFVVSRKSENS